MHSALNFWATTRKLGSIGNEPRFISGISSITPSMSRALLRIASRRQNRRAFRNSERKVFRTERRSPKCCERSPPRSEMLGVGKPGAPCSGSGRSSFGERIEIDASFDYCRYGRFVRTFDPEDFVVLPARHRSAALPENPAVKSRIITT